MANTKDMASEQRLSTPLLAHDKAYVSAASQYDDEAGDSLVFKSKLSPIIRVTECDPQRSRNSSNVGSGSDRQSTENAPTTVLPIEKRLKNIYWLSPLGMVSFLFVGIIAGTSHHFFYQSFAGRRVENTSEQQHSHE
jgi:hypothetical protein